MIIICGLCAMIGCGLVLLLAEILCQVKLDSVDKGRLDVVII